MTNRKYNTIHTIQKIKTKQHESNQNLGLISGAPKRKSDPASHVAPVVLLVLVQTR